MSISLHPSAYAAFNEKALALLQLVQAVPRQQPGASTFPSDVHVAASITDKDLIGEMEESATDYQGNTLARYFYIDGKRFGVEQESYGRLRDLASSICSNRNVRDKLSTSYVEKELFDWVRSAFGRDTPEKPFCESLILAANRDIAKTEAWVPIANLEIEAAFFIGRVELRPVLRSVIDAWSIKLTALPETHRKNAEQLFLDIRKKFQGCAAAVISVEAEPLRAFEVSIEQAELTTSLLAIFSLGSLLPDIKCLSTISGSESLSKGTVIFNPGGEVFRMSSAILDVASARPWRLAQKEVVELRKSGLDVISWLLIDDDPNDFKQAILNALVLYSKAAFTSEPIEKVIYVLSSLESMLLKNENEPIQQNLAERIAMFTATELTKRKQIISNIKATYSVRSRYLHHGHLRSELETIREFLMNAWVFYALLLGNAQKFSTRLEFVSAIDDAKLS
jgi:hypothetical protein